MQKLPVTETTAGNSSNNNECSNSTESVMLIDLLLLLHHRCAAIVYARLHNQFIGSNKIILNNRTSYIAPPTVWVLPNW